MLCLSRTSSQACGKSQPGVLRLFFLVDVLLFSIILFLIFFFYKFIYLFLLFIFGCVGSSLLSAGFSCSEWGLLFVAVRGLLIAVASLVVEHGL